MVLSRGLIHLNGKPVEPVGLYARLETQAEEPSTVEV